MRTTWISGRIFGLSVLTLALVGWVGVASAQTTAPAADAAPVVHKTTHHHKSTAKGTKKAKPAKLTAVDDLNAKSLEAAKAGTPFTPPAPVAEPKK